MKRRRSISALIWQNILSRCMIINTSTYASALDWFEKKWLRLYLIMLPIITNSKFVITITNYSVFVCFLTNCPVIYWQPKRGNSVRLLSNYSDYFFLWARNQKTELSTFCAIICNNRRETSCFLLDQPQIVNRKKHVRLFGCDQHSPDRKKWRYRLQFQPKKKCKIPVRWLILMVS